MYDKQQETRMELAPSSSLPTLKSDEPESERAAALCSSLFVDDKNTPKKEIISVLSGTNQKELSGPADFLHRNSFSSNSVGFVSASPSPIQDCVSARTGGADVQRKICKMGASAWNPTRNAELDLRGEQTLQVATAVSAKRRVPPLPLSSDVTPSNAAPGHIHDRYKEIR